MPIVSQFASFSHSVFPPYPLLPAPPRRLLLSAPKDYHHKHDNRQKQAPITITYTHDLLPDLTEAQQRQLVHAMTTLLDVSVAHLLGLLNTDAFRAAQVAFSREITGQNPPRPHTPSAFNADMDAWLVDHMIMSGRGEKAARERDEQFIDSLIKAFREKSGNE
jgi:hypothetical protein